MAGPADLAVEVISPENTRRDREEKLQEYQVSSVREYWVIDPRRKRAKFWTLDTDGLYHPVLPDSNGIYRSHVLPNFWLNVRWLYQDELTNHWAALAQIVPPQDSIEAIRRLQDRTSHS